VYYLQQGLVVVVDFDLVLVLEVFHVLHRLALHLKRAGGVFVEVDCDNLVNGKVVPGTDDPSLHAFLHLLLKANPHLLSHKILPIHIGLLC